MSYSSEDWRLAITNLLKKTSRQEIFWDSTDIFKADVWTEVDRSLQCSIKDKIYVVSQMRARNYTDIDEFHWVQEFDLSVFNNSFEPERLASAPMKLSIIGNLYYAAEESFAFKANALGDLL